MSEKMGLMEFAGYVEKNIRDYLPESLRDAEILCQAVDKPGYYERAEEPMMALTIRPAGAVMAPVVYLKEYHKGYLDGQDLKSVMDMIAVKSAMGEKPFAREELAEFLDVLNNSPEKLLPLVRPRLSPKDRVPDSCISRPYLDLAETYYLDFAEKHLTCTIRKPLLARMGVTSAQVEEAAKENMRREGPVLLRMGDLTDALMSGADEPSNLLDSAFFQCDEPRLPGTEPEKGLDLFVLTNKEKFFGAAYLADQDLHERIYKAVGEYYILPSSVHELLILPNRQASPYDVNALRGMVRDVNQTQVAGYEQLSNNVYVNSGKGVRPVFGEPLKRDIKPLRHRGR